MRNRPKLLIKIVHRTKKKELIESLAIGDRSQTLFSDVRLPLIWLPWRMNLNRLSWFVSRAHIQNDIQPSGGSISAIAVILADSDSDSESNKIRPHWTIQLIPNRTDSIYWIGYLMKSSLITHASTVSFSLSLSLFVSPSSYGPSIFSQLTNFSPWKLINLFQLRFFSPYIVHLRIAQAACDFFFIVVVAVQHSWFGEHQRRETQRGRLNSRALLTSARIYSLWTFNLKFISIFKRRSLLFSFLISVACKIYQNGWLYGLHSRSKIPY